MIGVFSNLGDVFDGTLTECFIDTSILFAATYPSDAFNTECEAAFDVLAEKKVKVFTNVNIRAEFLENHRRVLIGECLVDLLDDEGANYDGILLEKLKSHRTSFKRKFEEEKSTKMELGQIRMFRQLLSPLYSDEYGNGWDLFCRKYLLNKIEPIWDAAEDIYQLNFISLRNDDKHPLLNSIPQWKGAERIVGSYGVASSDAMILNMFLCSKIPVLLTADKEMAECAVKASKGSKLIFMPDSAMTA